MQSRAMCPTSRKAARLSRNRNINLWLLVQDPSQPSHYSSDLRATAHAKEALTGEIAFAQKGLDHAVDALEGMMDRWTPGS